MRSFSAFLAAALLILGLLACPSKALAESGKGKMGDLDRSMNGDRMERALDRELSKSLDRHIDDDFDADKLNERFTKELKDLREVFAQGGMDKTEFNKQAAELKADFLKDLKAVGDM